MRRRLTPLRALVAVQLVLLFGTGLATVLQFPVWALVDEGAHFDYVTRIADEGRIPVLDRDLVSDDVQAITEDVYPFPPRTGQREAGLAGESYEAVQPPLYYVLAAPASLAVDDAQDRVTLLRALNLLLLFGTVVVLWRLSVAVCGRRAGLGAFAVALTTLLWPGVTVRAITVSNAGLEIFITTATLLVLWLALQRRSRGMLLFGGVMTGLVLLTSLKLIFVAPVLVGVALRLATGPREERVAPAAAVTAVALPVLVLLPWLIFNLHHYDALTTTEAARALQSRLLGLADQRFGLADLPGKDRVLLRGLVPEEWWRVYLDRPASVASDAAMVLLIGVPAGLGLLLPRGLRGRAFGVLVAPLALGIAMINVTLVAADWDTAGPRYLYPALPAFGVFAALALLRRFPRVVARPWAAAAVTVTLAGLWAYLSTITPFAP